MTLLWPGHVCLLAWRRLPCELCFLARCMTAGMCLSVVRSFLPDWRSSCLAGTVIWTFISAGCLFGLSLGLVFPSFGLHSIWRSHLARYSKHAVAGFVFRWCRSCHGTLGAVCLNVAFHYARMCSLPWRLAAQNAGSWLDAAALCWLGMRLPGPCTEQQLALVV